jgi:hypothetical protein
MRRSKREYGELRVFGQVCRREAGASSMEADVVLVDRPLLLLVRLDGSIQLCFDGLVTDDQAHQLHPNRIARGLKVVT